MRVASVDLGMNSAKLLVTDGEHSERSAVTVRLGEGLRRTGTIQPEALGRTLEALRGFLPVIAASRAERVVAVTTAPARAGVNREQFLDAVEGVLGVRPVVLSGGHEARLAYRGARIGLPAVGATPLVIDIGGGSTEFAAEYAGTLHTASLDVGALMITEAYLRSDPPRADELSNAIGHVSDYLDDLIRDVPALGETDAIVGSGGTIRTAGAVEIGRYDPTELHGFWLSRDAAEDVFRTLATERLADRVHNPGLHADRAPIIVGGMCVLVAVLRRLRADGLTVSYRGVVDGVCASLLDGSWDDLIDNMDAGGHA